MNRYFNITGCCNPQEHYMVNLDSRLAQIKKMVDKGQYFSINKGRQYGKTTILKALREHLKNDYVVISVTFSLSVHQNLQQKTVLSRHLHGYSGAGVFVRLFSIHAPM